MKNSTSLLLILLLTFPVMSQTEKKEILYIGTYSDGGSKGIYVMEFNREAKRFKEIQTVHDKKNPTFLTIHPNKKFLYAAYREGADENDENGTIVAYQIEENTGKLTMINQTSSEGASPCHISVDPTGAVVFVSNYQGGNLASYKIREDGGIQSAASFIQHEGTGAHPERQKAPHMHSMIPSKDGKYVYASDLGIDKIMVYQVDLTNARLSPASTPYVKSNPGAGPRHFTIHQEIPYAYSVEELSNTVAIYQVDEANGGLKPVGRVDMLSDKIKNRNSSAADIHISKNGKYLYASNRGQDNLAIYKINPENGLLTLLDHQPSGGGHPRNFKVDEKGEYLFVANMDDNNVVLFEHDSGTGKLSPTGVEIGIPFAVCVEQVLWE